MVDEGHRAQHGMFNIDMQKSMPNACFVAFTGTPLFKKDKNTAVKFGGVIDYKQYEGQIQKLIDTHITTEKIETITDLVNIFDKDKFQQEVENTIGEIISMMTKRYA